MRTPISRRRSVTEHATTANIPISASSDETTASQQDDRQRDRDDRSIELNRVWSRQPRGGRHRERARN
jgi:hypothetical protein